MVNSVIRRTIGALVTILAVLTFVFFVVRITGDPVSYLLPFDYTDEQRAALEEEIGANKPIIEQYWIFIQGVAQGDLGFSHRWGEPAMDLVMQRLPETLKLAGAAFGIALVISVPLGIIAAARRGTVTDSTVGMLATAGQALPNYVLAVLLVWLFSVELGWLPVGGTGGITHYILPAFALATFSISAQTRIVRSAVADSLSQDYVRTARAKGLAPSTVMFRHALRSSLVPILTIIGLQWQFFLGGTIIIETVFAWPGVGRLMVDAVDARDFAVVQSCVFVLAGLFIVINAVTDVMYGVVDPRYR